MNFSTRTLLSVTAFICVILGIVFLMPAALGWLIMTSLALIVLPAFVQVGVFTTSGIRRSFFIGTAVAGIPHFVVNSYYIGMVIVAGEFWTLDSVSELWTESDESMRILLYMHLFFITVSILGGISGVLSHLILHGWSEKEKQTNSN